MLVNLICYIYFKWGFYSNFTPCFINNVDSNFLHLVILNFFFLNVHFNFTQNIYLYFLYLACNLCLKTPSQPLHQRSTPTTHPQRVAIITALTTSESPITWSTYLFRNKTCKGKSMLKNRNTIPKSLSWGKKRRWNLEKPVFLSKKKDNLRYVDNLLLSSMVLSGNKSYYYFIVCM